MPALGDGQDLDAVVSASGDGIVVVDGAGHILFVNPATERLLDRPAARLVGSVFGLPLAIAETTEVDLVRPDGARLVAEMVTTEMRWHGEPAVLTLLRDITLRRAAEEALDREMRLREEMISIVAHEFRTPLTVIVGLASMVRSGQVTEDKVQQVAARIEAHGQRLSRLVTNMLTVARLESGGLATAPSRFDVSEVIRRVVTDLENDGPRVTLDLEPAQICVDADQFEQIVLNCIENAFKYGGPPFEVRAYRDGAHVVVEVIDCGQGVPDEFIPLLFAPFQRSARDASQRPGTGLGLSVARSLAEQNGGTVSFAANEPHGARFSFRFAAA